MAAIFPSRSDYETLIRRLDIFAADSAIKAGKVLMRKDGLFPQAYSGGRAVVFPVLIDSHKYAIKCWIQSLGALEERYQAISRLIHTSKPPYLIEAVYRESEILFNGLRYPVLQMQWSDSLTLKEWISQNISDSNKILGLANKFLEVAADMHRIGMSHGDLQHDNILVNPSSSITLVDYDSIFLPGLEHLDDEVKGIPGYQHASRASQVKANPKSDFISEYVIYITLIALSKKPDLWSMFKDHNRLLFSQEDLFSPSSSDILHSIRRLTGLSELADALEAQCLCGNLDCIEPIETICSSFNAPPPLKDQNDSPSRSIQNPHQVTTRGKPSDLRKVRTWSGSNNGGSKWEFWSSDSKTNSQSNSGVSSKKPTKTRAQDIKSSSPVDVSVDATSSQGSQDQYSSQGVSRTISQNWPSLITPLCSIETSLNTSYNKRQDLISISFERTFLRFNCVSGDGKKSQLSISKKRFIGWRRRDLRIELVAKDSSGVGVVTISTDVTGAAGCIDQIASALVNAGISSDSISKKRSDYPSSTHETTIPKDRSNPAGRTNEEHNRNRTPHPGYSLFTNDIAIARTTGESLENVRKAVSALRFNPPFTILERDQIIAWLKEVASVSCPAVNSDTSRDSEAPTSIGQGYAVTDKLNQAASAENLSGCEFSYATFADIAKCTGKSVGEVRIAAECIGANPPFTLTEADRIAGQLVGDFSIHRAYQKFHGTHGLSRSSSSSDCFVATAIYGDPLHPDLAVLRRYRDEVLKSYKLGRVFVYCYYHIGPVFAFLVSKARLRSVLLPFMSLFVRSLSSLK